ncbi:MAG: class I SAM-dependent methyltransferase [Acidimicrobiales bacterium]
MRTAVRRVVRRIPAPVRRGLRGLPGALDLRDWAFKGPRTHDELYGSEYFEMVERTTAQGAVEMARSIVTSLDPRRVIDVGCGTGTLLQALGALGVEDGVGLEYASAAVESCRRRGVAVHRFDIESDDLPSGIGRADVVISMEVGQQLRPESSERYVDLLCALADVVVFSSAVPGQGDRAPRNEQPHEHWIRAFDRRGLTHDAATTARWRSEWSVQAVAPWFVANVMVFRRSE